MEPTATPAATPTGEPTPIPEPTVTPAPPDPPPVEPLEWSACGPLECATLAVPVDHDDPDGPTLDLALTRSPSRAGGGSVLGHLVMNPGGPGGSGIEFLANAAARFPEAIRDRFHLVSWDPRGVGASRGLDCNDDVANDLHGVPSLDDGIADDVAGAAAETAELGADCLASHPDLLDHVGTVATARDLDLIRRALGDEQLTYLGFSYGTRVGAVYATRFPERVRAMVLDGAFPPGIGSRELAAAVADIEAALGRIDATCDLEPGCPLGDAGVTDTVSDLLASLDTTGSSTGLGLSERATLLGATLLAIYVPDAWEAYAIGLSQATTGNLVLLENLANAWFSGADGGFNDIYAGANQAVMCADRAYPTDRETAEADARAALDAAPVLADLAFGATCEGWPVDGEALPETDTTGAPTLLVIGGTNDPATPLRWAEQLVDDLADAVLVAYVGDGHTIVGQGNDCVDDLVFAYLVNLEVPAAGTRCHAGSGILGIQVALVEDRIVVEGVEPGSAAAEAGLVAGDVVVTVDGAPATELVQLTTGAGQTLELGVERAGEALEVEVTAGRRPWTLPAG